MCALAHTAIAAPASASFSSSAFTHTIAPPIAITSCGKIQGLWDAATPSIAAFYGIPFAQPPTGAFRWMPPRDPVCWSPENATFSATAPAPSCPQLSPQATTAQSEDCLYLNVFTSRLPNSKSAATQSESEEKRSNSATGQGGVPVLVWIHGGGSVDGDAETYGPIQNMVRDLQGEIVLVALQYRLNSFGYLALRELSSIDPRGTSGNYGILDCQKALQWVQKNIAAFGGDPSRVGVFGQSSGGTQVLGLLASPASRGLFHAAISLSGSPNMTMPLAVMEEQGVQLVQGVGCENASDVLQCMYSKDTDTLRKATPQHWSFGGDFLTDTLTPTVAPYPGLVIVDGVTIPLPLPQALRSGLVDVPTIISTMQAEMDGDNDAAATWTNKSDFAKFCFQQFRDWPPAVGSGIASLYASLAVENAAYAYYVLEADVCVSCGNAAIAVQAGLGFRSPVYLVVNTHWPSHLISNDNGNMLFPFHDWDVTCAFSTFAHNNTQEGGGPFVPMQSDLDYGSNLRQLWLQLTRDGVLPPFYQTVGNTPGFPQSYNTLLLSNETASVTDYKTQHCSQLLTYGLDERFWWVN